MNRLIGYIAIALIGLSTAAALYNNKMRIAKDEGAAKALKDVNTATLQTTIKGIKDANKIKTNIDGKSSDELNSMFDTFTVTEESSGGSSMPSLDGNTNDSTRHTKGEDDESSEKTWFNQEQVTEGSVDENMPEACRNPKWNATLEAYILPPECYK